MDFTYIGYDNNKKRIVRGNVSAASQEAAIDILGRNGYRLISLKPIAVVAPSVKMQLPAIISPRTKPEEIIFFSRQLALLLESGISIVQALEIMKEQTANRTLKRVIGQVVIDLRSGSQLSAALSKHSKIFPSIYCRTLSVGERTGSLEVVLKQVADYMEKEATAAKEVRNALKYPVIVVIVAVIVVAVIVTFVFPSFANLYSLLGVKLPPMTLAMMSAVEWLNKHGLLLLAVALSASFLGYAYVRTPGGKYTLHKLMLRLPLIGRVRQLDELARCSRAMSLLFHSGLPLPEVMSLVIESSNNAIVKDALSDVRSSILKGEGIAQAIAKHRLFLPLMVQMVKVGEETGSLDSTLASVAQAFENEAKDKMRSLIGMIQPAITLIIGLVVAFIVLSLVQAMYSIYGQIS